MSSLQQTKKRLNTAGKIGLVCMFLIIIAGSFVRITDSGMGCPDWRKCFGYYIPPTGVSTVSLEEGRSYEKGQMVIYHDTLWIAEQNFNYFTDFWKTNVVSEAAPCLVAVPRQSAPVSPPPRITTFLPSAMI